MGRTDIWRPRRSSRREEEWQKTGVLGGSPCSPASETPSDGPAPRSATGSPMKRPPRGTLSMKRPSKSHVRCSSTRSPDFRLVVPRASRAWDPTPRRARVGAPSSLWGYTISDKARKSTFPERTERAWRRAAPSDRPFPSVRSDSRASPAPRTLPSPSPPRFASSPA